MVLSTNRAMRLIGSPRKGLEMDLGRGEAGGQERSPDQRGPWFRAAQVHVTLGHVRDPVPQGTEVVYAAHVLAHAVTQPGVRAAAAAGEAHHLQPALTGQPVELTGEKGLAGE